jgi:hypothetical protein
MPPRAKSPSSRPSVKCVFQHLLRGAVPRAAYLVQLVGGFALYRALGLTPMDSLITATGVTFASVFLTAGAFFAWLAARGLAERLGARRVEQDASSLPRFWQLFRFFVWGKVRREVYEPAYEELKLDYLQALLDPRYRDRSSQRILRAAFTFRTVAMVVQCIVAALGDRVTDLVAKVLGAILTPPQG